MNRDKRPIIIHVACGLLAAAFAVFSLFAFRTGATALGVVILVFLAAVCAAWVWALHSVRQETADPAVNGDEAEAVSLLFSRLKPKCFRTQIRECQKQLARLQEKTVAMDHVLHDVFGDSAISIDKFMTGLRRARMLFLANQKQIADRILLFDEEGYRKALKQGTVPPAMQDAFAFIDAKIAENEAILTRIDELNTRIQALKATPQLADGSAMRQLDELIEQSGLYRQGQPVHKKETD